MAHTYCVRIRSHTNEWSHRGPTPHQSGQRSAARAWGFGQTAHSTVPTPCSPSTSQSLNRSSNQYWQACQRCEGPHRGRVSCHREKAVSVGTPGLSLQCFGHNFLLLALGFHGFLCVPDRKLPRTKDRVTSFSCSLTQASTVPSLGSAKEMPVFCRRKYRPMYSVS